MKLLIVDDNAVNLKLLRAQLVTSGHEVLQALNGVEALRMLDQEAVDAVISDILMPEMDGFRLCIEVRRNDRLSHLPLVLYTSTYDSASDRELARSAGADAYLTKPAPTPVILEAIQQARSQRATELRATPSLPDEGQVLRQYNEALVHKLEQKNAELAEANKQLAQLNEGLERRVAERTADLEQANHELQTINRELETFSYSASHDLRSPLLAIDGFSAILEERYAGQFDDDGRQSLQRIRQAVRRMKLLIEDLLRLAKTAREPLALADVDLDLLVRDCLLDFDEELARRAIDVRIAALPTCRADGSLLRQLFVNLLGNALKYTGKQPHPLIEIGFERCDGEGVISVRDNGAGFDMKLAAGKLFHAFQRMHRYAEFEGTGVGLAIVQRIVQRHGGRIWAQAEVGKGATFFVALPMAAE